MTNTYAERTYLLPKVKQALTGFTAFRWPDSGRIIRDRNGHEIGCYSDGKRGPYIVACKRSLHQNVFASFMPRLVGKALVIGRESEWSTVPTLALFVGDGESYRIDDAYAFDPRRVANQADRRTHVDSKRERDVEIFDVSAQAHGVPLGDHLSGAQRLPGPTGDGLRPTTLKAFGVERGEV